MSKKLFPCIACKRHIRETEATCPFCSATPALLGLALLLGACSDSPPPDASVAAVYGAPPIELPMSTPTSAATPESKPASAPVSTPASAGSTVTPPPSSQPEKKLTPKIPPKKVDPPKNVPAYGGPRPLPKDIREDQPMYGSPAIPDFEKDPRKR
jgi:outer membrane biosynthesis protein TonB